MGLLTLEMWLLLLIAFVIGLIIGWLIWGRLKKQLESRVAEAEQKAKDAQAKADGCEKEKSELEQKLKSSSGGSSKSVEKKETAAPTENKSSTASATSGSTAADEPTAATEGTKPKTLSAPEGEKDDLKKISGVGPKLETTLNELGIYHFSQIAAWTDKEADWVDGYLSFKGRIGREKWIEQAKTLASGGETDFSKRQ